MSETLPRAAQVPPATSSAPQRRPRLRCRQAAPLWRWLPVSAGEDENVPEEARDFLYSREWTYFGECPRCASFPCDIIIDRCRTCLHAEPTSKDADWSYQVLRAEKEALFEALLGDYEYEPFQRLPRRRAPRRYA